MTTLSQVRRGVADPAAVAEFFAWLLDAEPDARGDEFRFMCRNGWLIIDGDSTNPVSIGLVAADFASTADPDGVPVVAVPQTAGTASLRLDHVRLNCADLAAAEAYYRELGFTLTWSGRGDEELDGPQESTLEGATWLHLSCDDGYLSLSQADWRDSGHHSTASGPPRFIHIGLSVDNVGDIASRLDRAGVDYLRGAPAVGTNIYLNDPEGQPELGTNIELIEYHP